MSISVGYQGNEEKDTLELTFEAHEAFVIDDDVKVIILGVSEHLNQARLGIIAPKTIRVWREEIYKRIQAEKEAASDPRE